MLVTAVITTFKRPPKLIERAVKSVLNQTHKNIELLLIDDSPSDYEFRASVEDMAQKYGIKYIALTKNSGPCIARNTGLHYANGEYIGFLDDDDEWLPNKIEEQLRVFQSTPDLSLVYCGVKVLHEDTGKVKIVRDHNLHKDITADLFKFGNFIGSTSFPLIKRISLLEINGFDQQLPSAEDYDVWLRLSMRHKIAYVDKILGLYYVHGGAQLNKNQQKKDYRFQTYNKEESRIFK